MRQSKAKGLPGRGGVGKPSMLPPNLTVLLVAERLEGKMHGMVFIDSVLSMCLCGAKMETMVTNHQNNVLTRGQKFGLDRIHWNSTTDSRS